MDPQQLPPPPQPTNGSLPNVPATNQQPPQPAGGNVGTQTPPYQPAPDPNDPYAFIIGQQQRPKQSFMTSSSLLQRVAIIVGGLVVLALIAWLVVTLLVPKNTAPATMLGVAQEQQEIIRVANNTLQFAKDSDIRYFAVNTSLSMQTDQQATLKYLTVQKVKVAQKELIIKQNAKTDALFASAQQTNTFDRTAAQQLVSMLTTYKTNLETAHSNTEGKVARELLSEQFKTTELLLDQASTIPAAQP